MISSRIIEKGWLFILSLLFCSACTQCREWKFDCEKTPSPEYSSSQMILPAQENETLALEIVSTISGLRMYVNVYSIPLSPLPFDDKKIDVTFSTEEASFIVVADLLIGGQRVLLPPQTTEWMITTLLDFRTVKVSVGRYSAEITPASFQEHYFKMFPQII